MNNSALHKEGKIGRMIGMGLGTGLGALIGMPGLGGKVGGMIGGGIGRAVDERQKEKGTGPYAGQETTLTSAATPIDPRITTVTPETLVQNEDPNQLITNNAIGNPGMIGAVADPNQDTYGSLFAPQTA